MRVLLNSMLCVLLTGCAGDDVDVEQDDIDMDQDGVLAELDCDDSDPTLGAVEDDADCDRALISDDCDDSDAELNLADADGDGFTTCDEDPDCDDDNPDAFPGAATNDGAICTIDADGDGHGDASLTAPYDAGSDCDDTMADSYPGADEALLDADRNCDGFTGGSLSSADYRFVGENGEDLAGGSVSRAGDVDGDGLDDILVGAENNDDGGVFAGKVYLILGSSLGSSTTIYLSDADYSFVGENGEDYAGGSVSRAGDVDGDGLDDLLVGAYYSDDGGRNAGKAYLILGSSLGSSATIDLSTADYSFVGENDNDRAGGCVSSAGDVDGDGLDDVFIGAYGNEDGGDIAGKAYLFFGSSLGADAVIELSAADYSFVGEEGDFAGRSVSDAGDVDGDGLDDLLIGSSRNDSFTGKVYLILGGSLGADTTIDLTAADYNFKGENTDDFAGTSVSSAGDVDGDGLDDILIGASGNDDGGDLAGKAYVVLGSSLGADSTIDLSTADYSIVGENSDNYAGGSVSSAGDVDGDGLDDIIIGASYNDSTTGKAYLILGRSLGADTSIDISAADHFFLGEDDNEYAGGSVSGAGDVNGDGRDDILIGATGNNDGGMDAGKAYLILSNL